MVFEDIARLYAHQYHAGQVRKKDGSPYVTHPEAVVELLCKYGSKEKETLATAWLHDTLEDTPLTLDQIRSVFGEEVAQGVYVLTRNVDREEYKNRLLEAPVWVQRVKLADRLHNMTSLEALSPRGAIRYLEECELFYLPLAEKVCPAMASELGHYYEYYKNRIGGN